MAQPPDISQSSSRIALQHHRGPYLGRVPGPVQRNSSSKSTVIISDGGGGGIYYTREVHNMNSESTKDKQVGMYGWELLPEGSCVRPLGGIMRCNTDLEQRLVWYAGRFRVGVDPAWSALKECVSNVLPNVGDLLGRLSPGSHNYKTAKSVLEGVPQRKVEKVDALTAAIVPWIRAQTVAISCRNEGGGHEWQCVRVRAWVRMGAEDESAGADELCCVGGRHRRVVPSSGVDTVAVVVREAAADEPQLGKFPYADS
ncbi:hypothetical protein FB451DRAFT_1171785 [Mycena latifolia]|nr:hypothetical protein FB451DRAFT_1171785 [Mycena latifolia]